eukprot:TRINITY_DN8834_c0_g1_i1.p1 TRINITY_DN8834_c0_g1~~TRINITY_DN8834_c0_g1_i1.p1  ORF type:complete len:503 (-),score=65.05 TRINITY_DN8834_c0_g1_i1:47-1555(-)
MTNEKQPATLENTAIQRIPPKAFQQKVQKLFNEIDSSRSNDIELEELREYLKNVGLFLPENTLEEFVRLYDTSENGLLSYEEFYAFMCLQEQHIWEAFSQVDKDKTGCLCIDEVKEACALSGLNVSRDQVMNMMRTLDKDRNGVISYDEFYDFMHKVQLFPLNDHHTTLEHIMGLWEQTASSIIIDIDNVIELPETREGRFDHPRWKYFFSAFLSASISRTATTALDRITCLMQVQAQISGPASVSGLQSFRTAFAEIRKEGWRGFFKANSVNICRIAPEIALRSLFYEHTKRFVVILDDNVKDTTQLTFPQRFTAGVSAALGAQTMVYPLDIIRTRMFASSKKASFFTVLKEIVRGEGFLSLYNGLATSLCRVGTDIAIYESVKKLHYDYHCKVTPSSPLASIPELLAMGTFSVIISQLLTYPLHLVQTRLQVQGMLQGQGVKHEHYSGPRDALASIYRKEGFRGFYRGAGVNLLRSVPPVSLTFFFYEYFKRKVGIYSAC